MEKADKCALHNRCRISYRLSSNPTKMTTSLNWRLSNLFSGLRLYHILVLALITPAWALAAADAETRIFDISAGDASSTFQKFASQSSEQTAFPADLIRGVKTAAVKGEFTPLQALTRMIAGTTLMAVRDEKTGALTVQKAPPIADVEKNAQGAVPMSPARSRPENSEADTNNSPVVLDPFKITANDSAGYGEQVSNSSSRLNLRYIDVPQSVSVMTSEFLADANVYTSRDFVKYTPNVYPTGNTGQTYFIRGLQISTVYVDGFLANDPSARDSALYDRIEVVKGPASAAMGRGEAAGLMNYVSKSPLGIDRFISSVTIGTDNFYRFELDDNIVYSSNVAFRIPLYYEDGDGTRGGSLDHTRKYGIGPSLLFKFRGDNQLKVNTAFFHSETPGTSGEEDFINANIYRFRNSVGQYVNGAWNPYQYPEPPPDQAWGYPGDTNLENSDEIEAVFIHKFSDAFSFRQSLRADNYTEDFRQWQILGQTYPDPADPNNFLIQLNLKRTMNRADGGRAQGDFLYSDTIVNTKQQLLVGYDYYNNHTGFKQGSNANGVFETLYNPTHIPFPGFNIFTQSPFTSKTKSWGDGLGLYAQYQGSFLSDRLLVIAGVRRDDTDTTTQDIINKTLVPLKGIVTTVPRFSLTYKPNSETSVYYVHSVQQDAPITVPEYNGIIASGGATLPPATSAFYTSLITGQVKAVLDEVGVKGNFFKNRVTASFAAYQMTDNGALISMPHSNVPQPGGGFLTYGQYYTTSGVLFKGYEAEITGKLTDRLTFLAGWGDPQGHTIVGTQFVPAGPLIETVSAFGKYDARSENHNGFEYTLGWKEWFGGWYLRSGSFVKYDANQFNLDASAAYYWGHGRWSVKVSGNNLTNDIQILGSGANESLRRYFGSLSVAF